MSANIKDWDKIPKVKTRNLRKQPVVTSFFRKFNKELEVVPVFETLNRISVNIRRQLEANLPLAPVDDVYNILCDPAMLRIAFRRLSKNKGAMTPGPEPDDTADSVSEEMILKVSAQLKSGTFRWSSIRRIYIPKPGKPKPRPLGLPNFSDKMVQEAIRHILNAVYEPEFQKYECNSSFRASRDCNHATHSISEKGQFADFACDIEGAYDNVNHDILMRLLRSRFSDKNF